ncbi:MAG: NAD(P)H-dependent oxidoreductase [Arenicellales bacterium]
MKRILFVKSSLNGEQGASTILARDLIAGLEARHPGSTVTTLDLNDLALPHLDAAELKAWVKPVEERDSDEIELAACSDRLIDQLRSHDTVVLAIPMYNLTVPSTLKVWIDRIARAGKTFRYTADGPVGLVKGVDAYAVFARGGQYRGTPMDTQTAYIKAVLGLIGIRTVETIFAEGLSIGDDEHRQALNAARTDIASVIGRTTSEEVRYANA